MLKILVRLYLVIIVAYAGALLFIPDTIVGLFQDRFMAYNLDQAKGVQSLIVRQFRQAPREQWPAVEQELASDFAPLELQLLRMDQADLSEDEQARLEHGLYAVRIAEWGYYETVLAPLDKEWLVRLHSPPDPLDINVLSWGVTVLIGAAMLGCLLLWVWPHWRDLERLKETARRLEAFLTPPDVAARMGGDEFVLLLGAMPDVPAVEARVAVLMEQLRAPYAIDDRLLNTTVSVGIAVFPQDDANPDIGDSAITETYGVGGMAMIAAPGVTRFVGAGGFGDALAVSNEMRVRVETCWKIMPSDLLRRRWG